MVLKCGNGRDLGRFAWKCDDGGMGLWSLGSKLSFMVVAEAVFLYTRLIPSERRKNSWWKGGVEEKETKEEK